jgi:hypothetical protein
MLCSHAQVLLLDLKRSADTRVGACIVGRWPQNAVRVNTHAQPTEQHGDCDLRSQHSFFLSNKITRTVKDLRNAFRTIHVTGSLCASITLSPLWCIERDEARLRSVEQLPHALPNQTR